MGFVGRNEAGDYRPELGSVVGFTEMGQLMHKDVVDKARGKLEGGDPRGDSSNAENITVAPGRRVGHT